MRAEEHHWATKTCPEKNTGNSSCEVKNVEGLGTSAPIYSRAAQHFAAPRVDQETSSESMNSTQMTDVRLGGLQDRG